MYIIGEHIHIISERVKEALKARDAKFFQELAVKQVEAGAWALEINLGPRKADGTEVFPWIIEAVQAVADAPICFDTTNLAGMEAGLQKITKSQPIINSTSAEPERLEKVPLLAKKYNARLMIEVGMSPEACAEAIVEAVVKGKHQVLVGTGTPIIGTYVKRLFPTLFTRLVRKPQVI